MNAKYHFRLSTTALVVSSIFAQQPALADEVTDLISPNVREVSVGIINASQVDGLYRQYSGIEDSRTLGSVGINIVNRDDNGQWFRLNAANLGTENQEARIVAEKQGDWSLGASYDQLTRYSYFDFTSNNTGIGTTNILSGAGPFLNVPTLKTERESLGLNAAKYLGDATKLSFSAKTEDKTGLRVAGNHGYVFAPEPINYTHTQYNAAIEHSADRYQISAGYYGSSFKNSNDLWRYNSAALSGANASAADNMFHQFFLEGAYKFTDSTKGSFRISRGKTTQDEQTSFFPVNIYPPKTGGAAIGTVGNLSGKYDDVEAFASLDSRLTKNTKLSASWRYEKRDDQTPFYWFHTGTDQDMRTRPESYKTQKGKLELMHKFGKGYSVTAGYDYTKKEKEAKPLVWYEVYDRTTLTEGTGRLKLRKGMTENVNGSITLSRANRGGSSWITPQLISASTGGAVYPINLSDRIRNKVRAELGWAASSALDIQAIVEGYDDDFKSNKWGLLGGSGMLFSLDGTYRISDTWNLNAWYSDNSSNYDQKSFGTVFNGAATVANQPWDAKIKYKSQQLGLGLKGRIKQVNVGMDYMYVRDSGEQNITTPFGPDNLPKTRFDQDSIKIYGEYSFSKKTQLRLEYNGIKYRMDDFAWQSLATSYNGFSSVYLNPSQTTNVVVFTLKQSF